MLNIYYLDKKVKKGNLKDLNKIKSKPIWIDAKSITKEESDTLKTIFDLHPLTAEDLHSDNVRIKVEEFPNYLFCVFYGVKKDKSIKLNELDFIFGENYIISCHKTEIDSFSILKEDHKRIENLLLKGSDFLLHKLLDLEIDNFSPVLDTLDDDIENVEEEVTSNPSPKSLNKILKIKRNIVHIKKYSLPQREKISLLTKNQYKYISKKSIPYFRDILDHAVRISETLENYRETISNVFDVYMSSISNKMNEVMKVLSIIATIMLPLTVISGIYGTNFKNLPGFDSVNGFWIMIGFMVLISAIMIGYFKKRDWF